VPHGVLRALAAAEQDNRQQALRPIPVSARFRGIRGRSN